MQLSHRCIADEMDRYLIKRGLLVGNDAFGDEPDFLSFRAKRDVFLTIVNVNVQMLRRGCFRQACNTSTFALFPATEFFEFIN